MAAASRCWTAHPHATYTCSQLRCRIVGPSSDLDQRRMRSSCALSSEHTRSSRVNRINLSLSPRCPAEARRQLIAVEVLALLRLDWT